MAAGTPLTEIVLGAASVTDDLGYVALTDLARALGGLTEDFRVIGGHMVTVLAARWQLGHALYRETGDVDLGIPPIVVRDQNLVNRLKDLNYLQAAGNRFARRLSDIPAGMKEGGGSRNPEALIDVLVPAYTSRARENVQVGEDLFTTEADACGEGYLQAPPDVRYVGVLGPDSGRQALKHQCADFIGKGQFALQGLSVEAAQS